MANYSALDDSASLGTPTPSTPSLMTDPLLAPRYTPSLTPEDQNLDYWNRYKLESGMANPRDELIQQPAAVRDRGHDPDEILAPVWGGKKPAEPLQQQDDWQERYRPQRIPTDSPGMHQPAEPAPGNPPGSITDAPPTGAPTYYNEDSLVPDRDLASSRRNLPPQDTVLPPSDPNAPRGISPSALQNMSYAGDVLKPYASGNAVIGGRSSVEGVKDEFANRIQRMVNDMPPDIAAKFKIISGFRDATRQHEVNPAVKNSRHMYGMAVDTTNDPDVIGWINNTRGKYGVDYTLRHLPNEQNHLEMVDPGGRRAQISGDGGKSRADYGLPAKPQTPSATAADQTQSLQAQADAATAKAMETVHTEYPIVKEHGITAVAGKNLEYWPPNEPGTPEAPRPASIPMDKAGVEVPPNTPPLDILGDIVSHHMAKKDPVVKKFYEGFVNSLSPEQKQFMQTQFLYYQKHEGEKRDYKTWEKESGLPAYFRGHPFKQWSEDFNNEAYTPSQRAHLDQMMDYIRNWRPPSALGETR